MTESCWNPDLWQNAPRKRCPCLVDRKTLSVTCGMRDKPTPRPVLMCRYTLPLVDMVNANGKGDYGRTRRT